MPSSGPLVVVLAYSQGLLREEGCDDPLAGQFAFLPVNLSPISTHPINGRICENLRLWHLRLPDRLRGQDRGGRVQALHGPGAHRPRG